MSSPIPVHDLISASPKKVWRPSVSSLWHDQQEVPRPIWWFVVLGCILAILAVVVVWVRLQTVTVRYSPDESALAMSGSRVLISDDGLRDYAQLFTSLQMNWTFETVQARSDRLGPYLHPRFRLAMSDLLAIEAKEAGEYRKTQHFSPVAINIQDRGASTATILVLGERALFTTPGVTGKIEFRQTNRAVLRIEVAQESTSPQNLYGLLVQGFEESSEEQWLKDKKPAFWIKTK